MKLFKVLIYLVLLQVFFTKCNVQKRIYRKGYYIARSHQNSNEFKKSEGSSIKSVAKVNKVLEKDEILLANSDRNIDPASVKQKPTLIIDKNAYSDLINNEGANKIKVKHFKKQNHSKKNKIRENFKDQLLAKGNAKTRVNYSNKLRVITSKIYSYIASIKNKIYGQKKPGQVNVMGVASLLLFGIILLLRVILFLVLSIVGTLPGAPFFILLFLFILPLVLAYASLFQFKREPTKYRGKWMPIALVCFYLAYNLLYFFAIWGWVTELVHLMILALFIVLLIVFIVALTPKRY